MEQHWCFRSDSKRHDDNAQLDLEMGKKIQQGRLPWLCFLPDSMQTSGIVFELKHQGRSSLQGM